MSVITSHYLSTDKINLEKELKEQGLVYEGELYSRKRDKNIHYDNILDFGKCCPELAEEYVDILKKKGWKNLDENGEWVRHEYTDKEIEDALKMPVFFSEEGRTMVWSLNYSHNDYPADAVSRLYPDITFNYMCETEGHKDLDIKLKDSKAIESFQYLIGNLGTEPEINMVETAKGKRAVVNAAFYAKSEENDKPDTLMQLSAWGDLGERISEMHTGDSLGISGSVKHTEKDGKDYYNVTVKSITYEKPKEEKNKPAKSKNKTEVER